MLDLKMGSPGNQHCANCIGTLSFPTRSCSLTNTVMQHFDKFDNDIANNYTLCLSLLCILVQ